MRIITNSLSELNWTKEVSIDIADCKNGLQLLTSEERQIICTYTLFYKDTKRIKEKAMKQVYLNLKFHYIQKKL